MEAEFLADPFLLRRDETWYLYFEVMPTVSGKGEIGLATSADGRSFAYQGIVLAEPFHLSYPLVFETEGEVYLLPETLGAGAARLYRATSAPGGFEPVADLVPGRLADSTVFFHAGRWWLFTCPAPERHDTLELYFADVLVGPWRRHPQSPLVVGNPRSARPAGRVVECTRAVSFASPRNACLATARRSARFEILELGPERYREIAAGPALAPTGTGWNGEGMHHLDAHRLADGSWLAVVDGYGPEPVNSCSPGPP